MNTTNTKKPGFISWIKKYPIKSMIMLLTLVIIFILIIVVINFKNKNTRFYFNSNDSGKVYLKQSDVSKTSELEKYLELDVTLKTVESLTVSNKTYEEGKYSFDVSFKPKAPYKTSDFSFRWMLTADFTEYQSDVRAISNVTSVKKIFSIEHRYNLPKSKYLFFKVDKPSLYIEITISKDASGSDLPSLNEDIVLYYKLNINDITYFYDVK